MAAHRLKKKLSGHAAVADHQLGGRREKRRTTLSLSAPWNLPPDSGRQTSRRNCTTPHSAGQQEISVTTPENCAPWAKAGHPPPLFPGRGMDFPFCLPRQVRSTVEG